MKYLDKIEYFEVMFFCFLSLSDSSQTKKRPLEKENCSLMTSTSNNHSHLNVILRATSP